MKIEELVQKINYYARLAKKRALTSAEKKIQQNLRQQYLDAYKKSMKQSLSQIKVVDEQGNDLTSDRIKLLKKELRGKNEK